MKPGARARPIPTILISVLAASVSACAGLPHSPPSTPPIDGPGIVAEVASYQLVADRPGRLLLALIAADGRWLSYGSVDVRFSYLGRVDASPSPDVQMPDMKAAFLAIPGSPDTDDGPPTLTFAADGRGVYAVEPITLPVSGYWQAGASGTLRDGTPFDAQAAFTVVDQPTVPSVGSLAPHTPNPIAGESGVPPAAIDSRASLGASIPDPNLHTISIADAIEAGHPALVVFSTPVYCVSRFCGPVTDLVAGLATEYDDRADFIHVEIYRDFEAGQVNQAALDWLSDGEGELREPWTFLIGADGRIVASWDTVVTRAEIEPLLESLPAKGAR